MNAQLATELGTFNVQHYTKFLEAKGYSGNYIEKHGIDMLLQQHKKYIDAGYHNNTAITMTEFWFWLFPMDSDEVSELLYLMRAHITIAHHPGFGQKVIDDLREHYGADNVRVIGSLAYNK